MAISVKQVFVTGDGSSFEAEEDAVQYEQYLESIQPVHDFVDQVGYRRGQKTTAVNAILAWERFKLTGEVWQRPVPATKASTADEETEGVPPAEAPAEAPEQAAA